MKAQVHPECSRILQYTSFSGYLILVYPWPQKLCTHCSLCPWPPLKSQEPALQCHIAAPSSPWTCSWSLQQGWILLFFALGALILVFPFFMKLFFRNSILTAVSNMRLQAPQGLGPHLFSPLCHQSLEQLQAHRGHSIPACWMHGLL